jgi:hypothetical protein
VRGVRLAEIAAAALAVVVTGCGRAAMVNPTSSSPAPTTSVVNRSPSSTRVSARYCQRLDDGTWVTNDSAYSTTTCVPDPSYATGDEQADGAVAIPRCFTCTLAEWRRAEERAETRAGGTPSTAATAIESTTLDGWTAKEENAFLHVCGQNGFGTCQCLADQLAPRVPGYEAGELSARDPRIQAAVQICQPSEGAVRTVTSSAG